jgi:hypothetical protein
VSSVLLVRVQTVPMHIRSGLCLANIPSACLEPGNPSPAPPTRGRSGSPLQSEGAARIVRRCFFSSSSPSGPFAPWQSLDRHSFSTISPCDNSLPPSLTVAAVHGWRGRTVSSGSPCVRGGRLGRGPGDRQTRHRRRLAPTSVSFAWGGSSSIGSRTFESVSCMGCSHQSARLWFRNHAPCRHCSGSVLRCLRPF